MEELLRTHDFVAFVSRHHMFNEVMETLRDENISIIGIYGMGGIGKTTLAMEIGKKAKDEGLFDNVVLTVASLAPNIRKIQGILSDLLGLAFKGTSEADRAMELSEKLKKEGRVMIILDDVWGKLDFADIGIPSRADHKGCRVVLTTRRAQVCDDMCCQRMFHLNVLDHNEALYLFSKHARISVCGSSRRHSKAKEVVKECGGLPLAIEIVGSALRDKSLADFDDAIRKLSRSEYANIERVDKEIYPAIKLSVDFLKCEKSVRCLTLFSLYPEDSIITLEDFTRIAFGLGVFENVNSVEEARQNTLRCVTTLLDACLLLPSEGTLKSWNSFQQTYEAWNNALVTNAYVPSVKVHDIVRDVALWLSRKDKFFYIQKYPTKKQRKEYEDATAISTKGCGLDCLIPDRLNCPKLKLLLVETGILGSQDGCFGMMSALQVLKLTVDRFNTETYMQNTFPVSIQHLHNLRTFLLNNFRGRWCPTKHLSVIGRLKNLQILSLHESYIKELPQEIKELTSLRLLDLFECLSLEKIPGNVLSSLTALEELYISSKFKVEKDLFSEIISLPHLIALTARVNWAGGLPTVSFRKPLQQYTIYSRDLWHGKLQCSRNVSIDVLDGSKMASLQKLFPQVEHLHIGRLQDTLENLLPECFENLTVLKIDACYLDCLINTTIMSQPRPFYSNLQNLKLDWWWDKVTTITRLHNSIHLPDWLQNIIYATRTCQPMPLFSNLQHLTLLGTTRMTKLCKGPPQPGWLANLRKLQMQCMDNCLEVQNIVPHAISTGPKLERLEVWGYYRLEYIFGFEREDLQHIKSEMSLFPCPQEMDLGDLHDLKGIWKWPNQWSGRNKLRGKWKRHHQLETLHLTNNDNRDEFCDLILEAMLRSLNSLVTITMCECEKLEEGFQLIDYNGQKYKEQFLNLRELCFTKLSALSCIWKGPHQYLHLGKLERISLVGCDVLTTVFTAASAASLHKLRSIEITNCMALQTIVECSTTGDPFVRTELLEEITLPNLQSLRLEKLPTLLCFSTASQRVICPSLQHLMVERCPLLGEDLGFLYTEGLVCKLTSELGNNCVFRTQYVPLKGKCQLFDQQLLRDFLLTKKLPLHRLFNRPATD